MVSGPMLWQSHLGGAPDARHVVIVGGGACAARKAASFARDGIHVTILAQTICDAVRDVLVDEHVSWEPRTLGPGDLRRSWLVLAATGDSATDAVVHRWVYRLRRRLASRPFVTASAAS